MTTARTTTASALLLIGALALAGCATTPSGGAASAPGVDPSASAPAGDAELDAGWLDGGRAIGLVTYGSSTCLPQVSDVTASGQTVTVTFVELEANLVCTRDYVPQGTFVQLPAGVDASQDIEIVAAGTISGDTDLDGLTSAQPPASDGAEFDPQASAGWFDDDGGLVLLTYGSSSCVPVFESVELASATEVRATVATPPADQVCTADYAPRVSVLQVAGVDDDAVPAEIVVVSAGAEDLRVPILR